MSIRRVRSSRSSTRSAAVFVPRSQTITFANLEYGVERQLIVGLVFWRTDLDHRIGLPAADAVALQHVFATGCDERQGPASGRVSAP
jgi:hypothetical protein